MKTRREILESFVAEDPNDSFSRYAFALELEKESGAQEAVAQLKEVISRDPNYVAAYQQLGRLLAQSELIDEAREVYRRGIELASRSGDQRSRNEMQDSLAMLE
jgi:Putative Zn-dependent protease, contains TPR repeats